MADPATLKITMGPVPYLWSGEKWRDFYYRIAETGHVDAVTLGEVVCSKRDHFTRPFLPQVVERLTAAGKSVALASLALVTLDRETLQTRRLAAGSTLVEANDLSALRLLAGKPHLVGPFVNVYNGATAKLLARRGATRICLGPELPAASIAAIIAGAPDIEYEIIAFGRLPLAISARCAHARAKGHTKDNCQFVCGDEPDGLDVDTLDGQPFLSVNGVQTMSRHCQVLLQDLPDLARMGVTHLRLSPQDCDMTEVAAIYAAVRDGHMDAGEGVTRLQSVYSAAPYSNGFLHGVAGMDWVAA
ncbi:U32 family peptidase [Devosia sp. XJ19-1]|uniref:Ubiquinone biosynthesis protein UbiV n=1 Tax=Devosia ureilytica TaxID=2952754 RepID=A0A9Q4FTA3_9HYPH|nr:U32 family peptidase [Devosia ureilytica]MCP8885436.1 U32 family peptidase [Devosia ureilytica]MCP8888097.1 U32 family peptidase [Devosia ureilytica]